MTRGSSILRTLVLRAALIPALLVTAHASAQEDTPRATGTARISGVVKLQGVPVSAGTVVRAYEIGSAQLYDSTPIPASGKFTIPDLPRGYYDLAVVIDGDTYVASQVVAVPPASKVELVITLAPFSGDESESPTFAGTGESSEGVAMVHRKLSKREFWKSPKGLAIIGGGAGAVLIAVAAGGGDDDPLLDELPASPFRLDP